MVESLLKEYSTDVYYILEKNNIAANALSWLLDNGNQETTHKSTNTMEIMSKHYDIKLP